MMMPNCTSAASVLKVMIESSEGIDAGALQAVVNAVVCLVYTHEILWGRGLVLSSNTEFKPFFEEVLLTVRKDVCIIQILVTERCPSG